MSTFEVKVVRLDAVNPIANADAIEVAHVGGYRAVVRKGQFKAGDLAIYIPEAAVLPERLIEVLGLTGKLAGSQHNRVKATKLRGVLSQGLVIPTTVWVRLHGDNETDWNGIYEDELDIAEAFSIVKYEPPIPAHLAGEVYNAGLNKTLAFDVENIKKFPGVLLEGEQVVMTEKLHGSCSFCSFVDGETLVYSKGLGGERGLCFKLDAPANDNNLYVKTFRQLGLLDTVQRLSGWFRAPVTLLGEVLGCQDLKYGIKNGEVGFRLFDLWVGYPPRFGHDTEGRFLNDAEIDLVCQTYGIERVPVVYRGPFSQDVLETVTTGKETVTGKELHIREGVVVKPTVERSSEGLGRVMLKSVSADYLCRKNPDATEFN